jgi:hypothetical protein
VSFMLMHFSIRNLPDKSHGVLFLQLPLGKAVLINSVEAFSEYALTSSRPFGCIAYGIGCRLSVALSLCLCLSPSFPRLAASSLYSFATQGPLISTVEVIWGYSDDDISVVEVCERMQGVAYATVGHVGSEPMLMAAQELNHDDSH